MKLVIFDLDGVLIDFCDVHYHSLNNAIRSVVGDTFCISESDHSTIYNGKSTKTKLEMLTERGLPVSKVDDIHQMKQKLTLEAIHDKISINQELRDILQALRGKGIKVVCATNCIRPTLEAALTSLGVLDCFDFTLSNQDVSQQKPSPEIYTLSMSRANCSPTETIIFEDSWVGLTAAIKSGAFVQRVTHVSDITLAFVEESIAYCKPGSSHLTRSMNVVIPMAGNGSRFANVGYKDPKPLIPVFGKPMISWVVKNIGVDAHYIFIIRRDFEHAMSFLEALAPGCSIIVIDEVTDGAARTVLLARKFIDNERPLLIANSDQYIEFSSSDFIHSFLYDPVESSFSAKISTFDGMRNPKWSYAAVVDGKVTEVKEKVPISDHATTGLYMWRNGSDFVRFADQMITKNIRVNNEFYVAPVFNEAIQSGLSVSISACEKMWGLGVPEDLDYFHKSFSPSN